MCQVATWCRALWHIAGVQIPASIMVVVVKQLYTCKNSVESTTVIISGASDHPIKIQILLYIEQAYLILYPVATH